MGPKPVQCLTITAPFKLVLKQQRGKSKFKMTQLSHKGFPSLFPLWEIRCGAQGTTANWTRHNEPRGVSSFAVGEVGGGAQFSRLESPLPGSSRRPIRIS